MKNDHEVKLYMSERRKGSSQRVAAARAGMSERTARKYEQAGKLPSELKRPQTWTTRQNPFEEDWPWVVEQLERDPALQASTLFALRMSKSILVAIALPRTARYDGISPGGQRCMDRSKR
jgi:hypothetical protein